MTVLLDANVLIALLIDDHVHHEAAELWLAGLDRDFATCPSTQGSFVRFALRHEQPVTTAQSIIMSLTDNPRHVFWPDEISYAEVSFAGVIGHRQVTDAYLAQLARDRGGRLATFDQGLSKLHADVADLVPVP